VGRLLEQLGVGYVIAVPEFQQSTSLTAIRRSDQPIGEAPGDAWQRQACGDRELPHAILTALAARAPRDARGAAETDQSSLR
jgi:hypothetical protein